MPGKKKLGSKLVSGVRQVQSQRKQVDATKSSTQVVDQSAEPTPASVPSVPVTAQSAEPTPAIVPSTPVVERPASVATEPVAPRAAQSPERRLNISHPRRIWPD